VDYKEFLATKEQGFEPSGFVPDEMNEHLFPFQRDILRWACIKGRSCIFADCGMGKTLMQLAWADLVRKQSGGGVLIVAPLAVSAQTVREGRKFGIDATQCREPSDWADGGINIINYERLHKFTGFEVSGVVLDESSILKSYSGKVRNQIIDTFKGVRYKLACTATPAPNDWMELGNHAEFVGAMTRTEMLAMFFTHDGGDTSKWRLKGHAVDAFWDWVSQWAVVVTKPSDLGYDDGGFELPPLYIHETYVESAPEKDSGRLFAVEEVSLQGQQRARRDSIAQKADQIAARINGHEEPWIVWCDLNAESEYLANSIPDAVEVKGSDPDEWKEQAMLGFSSGKYRVLVTKPSIAGFGMNWQHCSNVAFCGLSHSYEQFYQAVRRCWRYGQTNPVEVVIVASEAERAVVRNVMDKKDASSEMQEQMVRRTYRIREDSSMTARDEMPYVEDQASGDGCTLKLGDCVERIKDVGDGEVGYTIFSPPFASLYTYSNSNRDMGNCRSDSEFAEHFGYLVSELYRVTAPGRLVSFHCMNLPTSKERDGFIGIRDFRGELIRAFESVGFIFHSEVCIWKDPVTAMQRTKALGLLNKQKNKDSSMSRQGIPDYLVTMRKPGTNEKPIKHTNDEFPIAMWQRYASPVWMDVNPSRTLQYKSARDNADERHICPLQLDVIERGIDLWSAPGDLVLSPFAGIGSEGYVAVTKGRRFVGIELKPSYFNCAVNNLKAAEIEATQKTIFDFLKVDNCA
jgi:superfamily II DNA or RNA helicase